MEAGVGLFGVWAFGGVVMREALYLPCDIVLMALGYGIWDMGYNFGISEFERRQDAWGMSVKWVFGSRMGGIVWVR